MIIHTQPLRSNFKFVDEDGEHTQIIETYGAFHVEDILDFTYSEIPKHEGFWMLEVFTFAQRSHIVGIFASKDDVLEMINTIEDGNFFKDFCNDDCLNIVDIALTKDIEIADIILGD